MRCFSDQNTEIAGCRPVPKLVERSAAPCPATFGTGRAGSALPGRSFRSTGTGKGRATGVARPQRIAASTAREVVELPRLAARHPHRHLGRGEEQNPRIRPLASRAGRSTCSGRVRRTTRWARVSGPTISNAARRRPCGTAAVRWPRWSRVCSNFPRTARPVVRPASPTNAHPTCGSRTPVRHDGQPWEPAVARAVHPTAAPRFPCRRGTSALRRGTLRTRRLRRGLHPAAPRGARAVGRVSPLLRGGTSRVIPVHTARSRPSQYGSRSLRL